MLVDPGNPQKLKSKSSNRALYRVLCSRVDTYLVSQLQELQARVGKEDGFSALMLLRSLFANANDIDYKESIMTDFQVIKLHDNESVFDSFHNQGLVGESQITTTRYMGASVV